MRAWLSKNYGRPSRVRVLDSPTVRTLSQCQPPSGPGPDAATFGHQRGKICVPAGACSRQKVVQLWSNHHPWTRRCWIQSAARTIQRRSFATFARFGLKASFALKGLRVPSVPEHTVREGWSKVPFRVGSKGFGPDWPRVCGLCLGWCWGYQSRVRPGGVPRRSGAFDGGGGL